MASVSTSSRAVPTPAPRVRVVVVNFNGGEMTMRCLDALTRIAWPAEALEIVLVDNASTDGIAKRVQAEMARVHVVAHSHNAGFAGGANLVMRDVRGVDFVALLNNDAVPDRDWLAPLVDALERDPGLGAASSKIVFYPQFAALHITAPASVPPGGDQLLGVQVTGLRVDGRDVWEHAQFSAGCHVAATRGTGRERAAWTTHAAEVRVPVDPDASLPATVEVELRAEGEKSVRLELGGVEHEVTVTSDPRYFRLELTGPTFDVINNVGSRLVEGGYGADRGFLEPDTGQYSAPEEVFAWCGGSVLLSARYLRDVGAFDDRFFLYYEDTDHSWRGRIKGWRYRYVPQSVVRHEHAASTSEGSSLFVHYVERNRFATLMRNAPWRLVREALLVYLIDTLVIARRDVVRPVLARHRPDFSLVRARARALAAVTRLLPTVLVSRIRQRTSSADRQAIVDRWLQPR